MTACATCPVERSCHYPFKPCDCESQGKFWTAEQLREYERVYRRWPTPEEQYKIFLIECKAWVITFGGGE